jgi:hypothetical protein
VRYHALRYAATLQKVAVLVGCLAGSYVVAALINASPVIQPAIISSPRVIVVAPPDAAEGSVVPADVPAWRPESELAPDPEALSAL